VAVVSKLRCCACWGKPTPEEEASVIFGDDCPRAGCEGILLHASALDDAARSPEAASVRFGTILEHEHDCLVCRRHGPCTIRDALRSEYLAALPLDGELRSSELRSGSGSGKEFN
jgi:hypothetical protein